MNRREGFHDIASETRSPAEQKAFAASIARGVSDYCYERSSTYRQKMDDAGAKPADITSIEDLERIPVTRKEETKDMAFEGIMTVPYNQARRIFVSPGPQFYAYGPIPQGVNPLLRVYHAIGFRPGDIVLNTFSYHLTPAGINFDESLGEFGCAVIPAGPGNTEIQVEILTKLAVTGYVGTPSFLSILASRVGKTSLEVALTSAETLTEEMRAGIEEQTGAMVRQLYGSADGLLPCNECWAADGMHIPDLMVLEITRDEKQLPPGEVGEVTATVMNPYRPLLRFCNGDLGVITDEPCRCGRTSPRIYFKGRVAADVKVRGMFVHPDEISAAIPERKWRAYVTHDDQGLDVLTLEVDGEIDVERLRERIRVRPDVVRVQRVDSPGTLEDRR